MEDHPREERADGLPDRHAVHALGLQGLGVGHLGALDELRGSRVCVGVGVVDGSTFPFAPPVLLLIVQPPTYLHGEHAVRAEVPSDRGDVDAVVAAEQRRDSLGVGRLLQEVQLQRLFRVLTGSFSKALFAGNLFMLTTFDQRPLTQQNKDNNARTIDSLNSGRSQT